MADGGDYILLKWGGLKSWCLENSPEAFAKLKEYADLGMTTSAMVQRDTPEQKRLLCEMIDAFNGSISSGWSGETFTKETAKEYIMNYGA